MKIETFDKKWEDFKALAVSKLIEQGYVGDANFMSECLDYSFEEDYLHTDKALWELQMDIEIEAFKSDCSEDFK